LTGLAARSRSSFRVGDKTGGEGCVEVANDDPNKVRYGSGDSLTGGYVIEQDDADWNPPLNLLLSGLSLTAVLSAREQEVVAAAVRGLDTKGTAAELGVSPKTIDEMWRRVYRKFRCRSRVEVLSRLLASSFRLLAAGRPVRAKLA